MSLKKELDSLEEKYYGEWEESREPALIELKKKHIEAKEAGDKQWKKFYEEAISRFGGIYVPYLFWEELASYMEDMESRTTLFTCVQAFAESGFEKEEKDKMKPLLITYFTVEKEFELDKILSLIVAKAHPDVQTYFNKLFTFVEKNKTSAQMYIEKFDLLRHQYPDFKLARLPLKRLKEELSIAE